MEGVLKNIGTDIKPKWVIEYKHNIIQDDGDSHSWYETVTDIYPLFKKHYIKAKEGKVEFDVKPNDKYAYLSNYMKLNLDDLINKKNNGFKPGDLGFIHHDSGRKLIRDSLKKALPYILEYIAENGKADYNVKMDSFIHDIILPYIDKKSIISLEKKIINEFGI